MYEADLDTMTGRKVDAIHMNEDYLVFITNQGPVAFGVEGDCCSWSYFHDFIGVDKLLEADRVVSVEPIDLDVTEPLREHSDVVAAYGYKVVSEHPRFGEVTSVFSFRNDSNGYYGGWMYSTDPPTELPPKVTTDVLSTEGM